MAPAKNARVCIVSFSTFRPTLVTNVPDFYKKKYDKSHNQVDGTKRFVLYYLPKPGKNFIVQYCDIHHNCSSLMDKMETTAR
jgi:hypothetical protein